MRRRTLNLTVSFMVLAFTLSFVTILPVASQDTGPVITKLYTLRGMLENERPALANKVNAVIHQIEAGALNGAWNKMKNDVKKSITAWVDDPVKQEDLIDLVNEIIKDIEDLLHPRPATPPKPDFEISADPTELEIVQGGSKTSNIMITSENNFNQEVVLTNATDAPGVTLSLNPTTLTPPKNGSVISKLTVAVDEDAEPGDHEITVTGTSVGLKPKSVEIELKVTEQPTPEEDTTSPTIASVQRNPATPAYNESVTVTAFVYDTGVPTPSGVKQVILNYSSGSAWTKVNMTLSGGLYNASVPAFPFDRSVEYRVFALDNKDNVANPSSLYSYKVIDPYPPMLRIDRPAQGSYLSSIVAITAFMMDQNSGGESGFGSAELSINSTVVKTWAPPAPSTPVTYNWNTTAFGPDGVYVVKLSVHDKAGNVVEKSLTVTVDNTLPSAAINAPTDGSYLRLSTLIKVTGSDANFDKMEVRIDDQLVRTSTTKGSETIEWNTRNYGDGVHSVTLKVYDKAGNFKQIFVNVSVDNTPPVVGTPSWLPKEPAANVDIQINVTVSEPTYGSGVQNVTLLFKNKTREEWQSVPMQLKDGNWTATLSNQSDTDVRFFIEAFDKAGNSAKSEKKGFPVAAPAGLNLAWILATIAAIGAGSGGGAYYMRRRRKKGMHASSVPATSVESVPPSSPAPARKPVRRRVQSGTSLRSVHSR